MVGNMLGTLSDILNNCFTDYMFLLVNKTFVIFNFSHYNFTFHHFQLLNNFSAIMEL